MPRPAVGVARPIRRATTQRDNSTGRTERECFCTRPPVFRPTDNFFIGSSPRPHFLRWRGVPMGPIRSRSRLTLIEPWWSCNHRHPMACSCGRQKVREAAARTKSRTTSSKWGGVPHSTDVRGRLPYPGGGTPLSQRLANANIDGSGAGVTRSSLHGADALYRSWTFTARSRTYTQHSSRCDVPQPRPRPRQGVQDGRTVPGPVSDTP